MGSSFSSFLFFSHVKAFFFISSSPPPSLELEKSSLPVDAQIGWQRRDQRLIPRRLVSLCWCKSRKPLEVFFICFAMVLIASIIKTSYDNIYLIGFGLIFNYQSFGWQRNPLLLLMGRRHLLWARKAQCHAADSSAAVVVAAAEVSMGCQQRRCQQPIGVAGLRWPSAARPLPMLIVHHCCDSIIWKNPICAYPADSCTRTGRVGWK
jgi:hypothetical protein